MFVGPYVYIGLSIYYVICNKVGWVREKIMLVSHGGGREHILLSILVTRGVSKKQLAANLMGYGLERGQNSIT